jgi:putative MATE family efflux protein
MASEVFSRRSIASQILVLTWPTVVEQLLGLTVGLINTYMVGHLGASALAAVGLSTQLVNLFMGLFSAVGVGSTALIARFVGGNRPKDAQLIAGQSMLLAVAVGLLTVVPCALWGGTILDLLGGEPDVVGLGASYLGAVGLALPLMAIMFIGNAAMRGAGDTRTPMLVMGLVNLVNVTVSWTLINGVGPLPPLGVQGAGIGYATGVTIGGLTVASLLASGGTSGRLHIRLGALRVQPQAAWRLLRIGLPSGAEQMIMRVAQLATATVATQLGTAAYAGHQLGLQFLSIAFMPGFAFSVSATTLVGQELGRNAPKRAEACAITTGWMTFVVMCSMGMAAFLTAERLLQVFTGDPEVIRQGLYAVRMGALIQPPLAWYFILGGALRGAGDTAYVLLAQSLPIWLIRIPLAFLLGLSLGFGLTGVWLAMVLDMTGRAVLLTLRFRTGAWKRLRV